MPVAPWSVTSRLPTRRPPAGKRSVRRMALDRVVRRVLHLRVTNRASRDVRISPQRELGEPG